MKKTMFVAAAALTGLLAGTSARAATFAPVASENVSLSNSQNVKASTAVATADAGLKAPTMDAGKHDCKGKNDCKSQGGCKTDKNDCKGKNACKGQGGCKTN